MKNSLRNVAYPLSFYYISRAL